MVFIAFIQMIVVIIFAVGALDQLGFIYSNVLCCTL